MRISLFIGILAVVASTHPKGGPKVYLGAKSAGNTWNAARDQSQEMSKDFAKDCPEVQVTTNAQDADYQVLLNHLEIGLFVRDNQIAVTDMFGNLLSQMEKGSIKGGLKKACVYILSDWSNQAIARQRLVQAVNASFQRDRTVGYAEILGDKLTVHSEHANAMHFRMILANEWQRSMMQRAGIATFGYTNDGDQTFTYDVETKQVTSATTEQAVAQNK
jgi:hypothetical protein